MKTIRTFAIVLACLMMFSVVAVFFTASAETIEFKPEIIGDKIYGIPAGTTVKELKKAFPKSIIEVTDNDGKAVAASAGTAIGTGFTVKITSSVYTAVILGDVNGDGKLTGSDYSLVKRAYLGTYEASDIQLRAAGVSEGEKLRAINYMKVKRACLGTFNINGDYTVEGYDPASEDEGWTTSWV